MSRLPELTFALVANGRPESPPAADVRAYLQDAGARVTTVFHPLSRDEAGRHVIATFAGRRPCLRREFRLPSFPPWTYVLDPLIPLPPPRADVWIGFNNLAALQGLALRRAGRVRQVVYWAVDFVPNRFGVRTPATRVYDAVDALVSRRSDLRVELTAAAAEARAARLQLEAAAPSHVAPIGIWRDRVPRTAADGWRSRRVIFAGHLVERQGVATLLEAVALLPDVRLDVTGTGPLEADLRRRARDLGLGGRVTFHGHLADREDVERLLAQAAVAAAPYATDPASFTRFADPAKLRAYVGAGLPVVLTDVPPNAREIASEAGGEVVADDARSLADAIARILSSPAEWERRRAAALAYADRFDWRDILDGTFARLGIET